MSESDKSEDKVGDTMVLGVYIGTTSGWDQPDTYAIQFYNFTPNEVGVKFLAGAEIKQYDTLFINFEDGAVSLLEGETEKEVIPNWSVFNRIPVDLGDL